MQICSFKRDIGINVHLVDVGVIESMLPRTGVCLGCPAEGR